MHPNIHDEWDWTEELRDWCIYQPYIFAQLFGKIWHEEAKEKDKWVWIMHMTFEYVVPALESLLWPDQVIKP